MIVYLIQNRMNGKGYVGQTIRSFEERWKEHCQQKELLIDRSIRKYGSENFETRVVAEVHTIEELNILEAYHIKAQGTLFPNGYNLKPGGNNAQPTAETRAKQSASHIGRSRGPLSLETKAKIRVKLTGNKNGNGNKAGTGLSPWNKGKSGHLSQEQKEKLSTSHMGIQVGIVRSDETKTRMKQAWVTRRSKQEK